MLNQANVGLADFRAVAEMTPSNSVTALSGSQLPRYGFIIYFPFLKCYLGLSNNSK